MSEPNRIGVAPEHDRNCLGHPSGWLYENRRGSKDDIDIHANQFGRESGQLVNSFGPPELDGNVGAFDVAEFTQSGPKSSTRDAQPEPGSNQESQSVRLLPLAAPVR